MDTLTSDRILDALLREETRRLNLHLPRERKTLEHLLQEETPTVKATDSSEIVLDKKSLEKLAILTPSSMHSTIRLPIVIMRRLDLGKSVFTVLGDNVDRFVVNKMLGWTDTDPSRGLHGQGMIYLYRPHIAELVREFHSLLVVGFGTSEKRGSFFAQS